MYRNTESMLELTRFIIEKTDVRTSDECELDDELIHLTEKLITYYAAPRYKFLKYLFGMVYLELTNVIEETKPAQNSNLRLITYIPAELGSVD